MVLDATGWYKVLELALGSGLVVAAFGFLYNERQKLHGERQKRRDLWVSTMTTAKHGAHMELAEAMFQAEQKAEILLRLIQVSSTEEPRERRWALIFAQPIHEWRPPEKALKPLGADEEELQALYTEAYGRAYVELRRTLEEVELKATKAGMHGSRLDSEGLAAGFSSLVLDAVGEDWQEFSESERYRRLQGISNERRRIIARLIEDLRSDYDLVRGGGRTS